MGTSSCLWGIHKYFWLLMAMLLMVKLAERCCHTYTHDLLFRPLLLIIYHLCVIVKSHWHLLKICDGHLTTFLCLVDVGVRVCRVLTSIVVVILLLKMMLLYSLLFLQHHLLRIKRKNIGWSACGSSHKSSIIFVTLSLRSRNLAIILIFLVIISIEGCNILNFVSWIQSFWNSSFLLLTGLIDQTLNLVFLSQFRFRSSCACYSMTCLINAIYSFLN